MREVLRPFTKEITGATGSDTTFDLKDSDGNFIDCNYCIIESVAAVTDTGYAHISPVNLYSTDVNLGSTGATTAGAGGVVVRGGGGPGELIAGDGDRFRQIKIRAFGSAFAGVITYGQIQHASELRDNERPQGV